MATTASNARSAVSKEAAGGPLKDGELVSQNDELHILGEVVLAPQREQLDAASCESIEESKAHGAASLPHERPRLAPPKLDLGRWASSASGVGWPYTW